MIETITEMMTEMMTETLTGLQVPESFVSVTGSGSLMDRNYIQDVLEVDLRMDGKWIPGQTASGSLRNKKWVPHGQEVDPRMDRNWVPEGQEGGPG